MRLAGRITDAMAHELDPAPLPLVSRKYGYPYDERAVPCDHELRALAQRLGYIAACRKGAAWSARPEYYIPPVLAAS